MVDVGDSVEVVQSYRPSHRNGQENTNQPRQVCVWKTTGSFKQGKKKKKSLMGELTMNDDNGNTSTYSSFRISEGWGCGTRGANKRCSKAANYPDRRLCAVQGRSTPYS